MLTALKFEGKWAFSALRGVSVRLRYARIGQIFPRLWREKGALYARMGEATCGLPGKKFEKTRTTPG